MAESSAHRRHRPDRPIRVLSADLQPLFQDPMARALERHPSLELVEQVNDPGLLGPALQRTEADVALVDEDLVPSSDLPPSRARLILLATGPEPHRAYEAIEAGAAGYVLRDREADALCDAVSRVAAGQTVIDPDLHTGFAHEVRLRGDNEGPLLSDREHEILRRIADKSNPDIAEELHVSAATVRSHTLNIYKKLGVGGRAEAVREAMRRGLIE